MMSAFKNWFYRCRCSQDISLAEKESIFALEILRDEQFTSLRDEADRYKRSFVEAMDSLNKKEAMCLELTKQVEHYRTTLKEQKKPKKQVVQQPVNNKPVKNNVPVGHIPECMD